MATSIEVIIPWAGGCEHRQRALDFVTEWHDFPVTLALGGSPWSKGAALRPALEESMADIVIVADADCTTLGLPAAIKAVKRGAPWAVPHRLVTRLTEETSRHFMETGKVNHPLDRRQYTGFAGGGFVVARRETLLDIGPDPRFIGWGQEDESWALALTTLAGKPWRGDADLIHLWHPPQPKETRRKGSGRGWQLFSRYYAAQDDPVAMRSILKEIHDLETHQPSVSTSPSWP